MREHGDAVAADDALRQGREAYARRAWPDARRALRAADAAGGLGPADLELLATCAYMLGRDDEVVDGLTRAHHAHAEAGAPAAAARCAFWLGLLLMPHDAMLATGWIARAQRVLAGRDEQCVEQGWLLLPVLLRHVADEEWAAAGAVASEAARIAARFGDADLLALAGHEEGFALIRQGRVPEGLARIDEAMVAVVGGELSPIVTGLLYCSVLAGCHELCQLRRASAWTDALEAWCDGQPSLVAFTGHCLLHRAEVLQHHGAWDDALSEAERARLRLEERRDPGTAAAAAAYRQGEILRLRGDLAAAETAYRTASRQGFEPQPGLALLRLEQGAPDVARATIVRALAEQRDPARRGRLLPACVEIALAAGDREAAEGAAAELERMAAHDGAGMLAAHGGRRPRRAAARRRRRSRGAGRPAQRGPAVARPAGAVRGGAHPRRAGPARAGPWATTTPRPWSWTPPPPRSPSWARVPTWRASTTSAAPRRAPTAA